jgi:hypothetical protein
LRLLIACLAILALNAGLWARRMFNRCGEGKAFGGGPLQGVSPASDGHDGGCPEKPVHLAKPTQNKSVLGDELRQVLSEAVHFCAENQVDIAAIHA